MKRDRLLDTTPVARRRGGTTALVPVALDTMCLVVREAA